MFLAGCSAGATPTPDAGAADTAVTVPPVPPLAAQPISQDAPSTGTGVQETSAGREAESRRLLPPEPPPFDVLGWATDFSRRTVDWAEILSGGPPRDGIPPIDAPRFESVAAAAWLSERDPVVYFEHRGDVRGYPLAVLMWHEIVNDRVGAVPVAVTFCPLCNASIVFRRAVGDRELDFGTTGRLRNSDLIMYDRQTESWWQQFTGEAIVGEFATARLDVLPSQVISFGDFASRFPEGRVLARPASDRSYGSNPYRSYDSTTGRPFLHRGRLDDRLPATERVVGLSAGGVEVAYPFAVLAAAGAIHDEVGGESVVVLHKAGMASALDQRAIRDGRDVGSAAAFGRRVDGRTLTFVRGGDGNFTDAETGSTWNILGESVRGPLAGAKLPRLQAFDHFWFAWRAFHPETRVFEPR